MKTMMKIWISFLALPFAASAAPIGGESTGGGGARSQLMPKETVIETVKNSRLNLYFFLHFAEARFHDDRSASYFAPFFRTEKDPFELLKRTKVETKLSGECKDPEGDSVDASAFASTETICVDVDRLSKKLADTDAGKSELLSLMAHEFSHLLGANEREARKIQQVFSSSSDRSAPDFAQVRLRDFLRWNRKEALSTQRYGASKLAHASENGNSWALLDDVAQNLVYSYSRIIPRSRDSEKVFGPLPNYRAEPLLDGGDRFSLLVIFAKLQTCANAKPLEAAVPRLDKDAYLKLRDMDANLCQHYLNPAFRGANEVSLKRFVGFAKGAGLIPFSAGIFGEATDASNVFLKKHDAKENSLAAAFLKQLLQDESMPGSLASLAKLYEQVTAAAFAEFALEVLQ